MSTDTGIKRKLCRELPREKGESFEVWHKELMDAAHGEGDEDASWAETYLGQDPRAGLTPAQTRRRAQRNRQAVSALLAVIPDADLKAVLRAAAVNRPAGAPGLRTDATIAYNTLLGKHQGLARGCVQEIPWYYHERKERLRKPLCFLPPPRYRTVTEPLLR